MVRRHIVSFVQLPTFFLMIPVFHLAPINITEIQPQTDANHVKDFAIFASIIPFASPANLTFFFLANASHHHSVPPTTTQIYFIYNAYHAHQLVLHANSLHQHVLRAIKTAHYFICKM